MHRLIIKLMSFFFLVVSIAPAKSGTSLSMREKLEMQADLFLFRCGACHAISGPPKNGPPLLAISDHYKADLKTYDAFQKTLINFIQKPDSAASLMPGALAEFGLMPKMDFNPEELSQITEFLWYADSASKLLPKTFSASQFEGITLKKGGKLFAQNCGACHSFEPPPRNGPPARGMTRNYQRAHSNKKSFSNAVKSFIDNPTKEKAVMPNAVQRFGLMPKMDFDEEALNVIIDWLWETYSR